MYGVPVESQPFSKLFTIFFFTWGLIIIAGALGDFILYFAGSLAAVAKHERRLLLSEPEQLGRRNWSLAALLGWSRHKKKYYTLLLALFWLALGA